MKCPSCDDEMERDGKNYSCSNCGYSIANVFITLLILAGIFFLFIGDGLK